MRTLIGTPAVVVVAYLVDKETFFPESKKDLAILSVLGTGISWLSLADSGVGVTGIFLNNSFYLSGLAFAKRITLSMFD